MGKVFHVSSDIRHELKVRVTQSEESDETVVPLTSLQQNNE